MQTGRDCRTHMLVACIALKVSLGLGALLAEAEECVKMRQCHVCLLRVPSRRSDRKRSELKACDERVSLLRSRDPAASEKLLFLLHLLGTFGASSCRSCSLMLQDMERTSPYTWVC